MKRSTSSRVTACFVAIAVSACKSESTVRTPQPEPVRCGDGQSRDGERCDDGNESDADGCSRNCAVEIGWSCDGLSPSHCEPICGDGLRVGSEACDDGNADTSDGCAHCVVRRGYTCRDTSPTACAPTCGDGALLPEELCDDGNTTSRDGCDAHCRPESGWICDRGSMRCDPVCGDGLIVGSETCDDGNLRVGDGCSPRCVRLDTWIPLAASAAAPPPRGASAVWTGGEVLMWAGRDFVPRAFRPETGAWRILEQSPDLEPEKHHAHWTGRELLVLGGHRPLEPSALQGALYNPQTNVWRPLTRTGAPASAPVMLSAWTGSELIAWCESATIAYGGIFDEPRSEWRPISSRGAPRPEEGVIRAVWSGSELFIFRALATGGLKAHAYDPARDHWRALSVDGGPEIPAVPVDRYDPEGTVHDLILAAGGGNIFLFVDDEILTPARPVPMVTQRVSTGARFELATETWHPITLDQRIDVSPTASIFWSGSELLVFGEHIDLGRRYAPALERWAPLSSKSEPESLRSPRHPAILAGTDLLVLDPGDGTETPTWWRLDPAIDRWGAIADSIGGSRPPPSLSSGVIWGGDQLFVLGGQSYFPSVNSSTIDLRPPILTRAWRYSPPRGTWEQLPDEGAPEPRISPLLVWTGHDLVVWGGWSYGPLTGGARFDPVLNRWSPMSNGRRRPRLDSLALFTDREMFVFSPPGPMRNDPPFAAYNPTTDLWRRISARGAPETDRASAFWTGDEVLFVWNEGVARYLPATDTWSTATNTGGPFPTIADVATVAAFAAGELLVIVEQHLFAYRPSLDRWAEITVPEALEPWLASSGPPLYTGAVWLFFEEGVAETPTPMIAAVYDPLLDRWGTTPASAAPRRDRARSQVWTGQAVLVWGGQFEGGVLSY